MNPTLIQITTDILLGGLIVAVLIGFGMLISVLMKYKTVEKYFDMLFVIAVIVGILIAVGSFTRNIYIKVTNGHQQSSN